MIETARARLSGDMHRFHAAFIFALVVGCGDDTQGSGDTEFTPGSSTSTTDGPEDGSTSSTNPPTTSEGSTTGDGSGESTEAGSSEEGSSSGGTPGLDPLVGWETLLPDAEGRAAAMMPSATLGAIGARGLRSDGLVDLSDEASEPLIEFRFSVDGSDTGVSVTYSPNAYDPDAEALDPSVTQINGNALVPPPLTQTAGLPSFAAIAQSVAATEGCTAFAGTPDDGVSIRMELVFESYVEVSAYTTTGSTSADAFALEFDTCS